MQKTYRKITQLIVKLGDTLPAKAGKITDIGVKKQWLTKQDISIEKKISSFIETLPGEHNIFAEELHTEFIDSENVWVIDPISHTFSYLYGLPHYAVVIAHLYKGVAQFCVVYDPTTKELFTAQKNKGAFLNKKKIHVSDKKSEACILFEVFKKNTKSDNQDTIQILEKLFNYRRVKIIGSVALDYAYVAAGRAQAAVIKNEDGFTALAGQLLVEEAGGKFTDFDGKKYTFGASGAVASQGVGHSKIINMTKSSLRKL